MTGSHPLFARLFDRVAAKDEERGQAELRQELLVGLAGRVVEVGVGNGLDLPHYPTSVDEVIAVEPEPYLRERADAAAAAAPVTIKVVDGSAEALPVDDGTADAVVVAGVLFCRHLLFPAGARVSPVSPRILGQARA